MPQTVTAVVTGEPGPNPVLRAVLGLLLGACVGVLAALLLPRRKSASPEAASPGPALAESAATPS